MHSSFQTLSTLPPAVSSRWLITFGDLLTLLLCFFITVIRLGPLGQPQKELPKQGLTAPPGQHAPEMKSASGANIHGTNFADKHLTSDTPVRNASQAGSLRIDLGAADFDVTGTLLSDPGKEKLKGLVASGEMEIETCGNPDRAGAWQELMARSLSLHATLKAMEVPGSFLFRMTPSGCVETANSDSLAIVRFKSIHG